MRAWVPTLLLLAIVAEPAGAWAQLSGGSFGGSRGFGGGGGSSYGGGGSSYGGGGSSYGSGESFSDRMARERRAREAREDRERARREADAARRRAEEARQRAEQEAELARQRQLEADRALPPAERARLERRFGPRLERPRPDWAAPAHAGLAAAAAPRWEPSLPNRSVGGSLVSGPMQRHWRWPIGIPVGLAAALGFYGLASLFARRRRRTLELVASRRGGAHTLVGPAGSRADCEIRRVSLGFDWSERANLQRALAAMANRYDLRSAHGMHGAASEAAQLLVGAIDAARYGAFQTFGVGKRGAEKAFFTLAQDLESRYRHDSVRDGSRQFRARPEEGEGMVVVSFVVGATTRLGPMPAEVSRAALGQVLQSAVRLSPAELVALEVVWSPAADADRMSSLELETVYPELLRLDDAPVGRRSCGHCQAVFAAELARCPACGAST